jgi:hypothetical protein
MAIRLLFFKTNIKIAKLWLEAIIWDHGVTQEPLKEERGMYQKMDDLFTFILSSKFTKLLTVCDVLVTQYSKAQRRNSP